MSILSNLSSFFSEGGPIMFAIAFIGVVAAGIGLERWIRIHFQYSINSRAFMAKLKKYILSDNIDRAISLCNSRSQALLPRVLKNGLTRAKDTKLDIQNALDEATLEALPKLEERSLYLPTLSNLATLTGLFGTISGLVVAFKSGESGVDAVQRQQYLQSAISMAMHTTLFGLFVAIPTLFVHTIVQSKINGIISDIDQYSVKLINLLTASQKVGQEDEDSKKTKSKKA